MDSHARQCKQSGVPIDIQPFSTNRYSTVPYQNYTFSNFEYATPQPPQPVQPYQQYSSQIPHQQHAHAQQQQQPYLLNVQQPQPAPQHVSSSHHTPQPQQPHPPPAQRQSLPQQDVRREPSSSPEAEDGAAENPHAEIEAELERQLLDALNNPPEQQEQDQTSMLLQQYPNQGDENDPIYNLPAPPEATYANERELDKAMHEWSLEHGYELVRRASKKNAKGEQYKRYYDCSKHSRKRSRVLPEERKRKKKVSNDSQCPMSLATVAVDPSNPHGEWQIRHRKTHHNHPAEEPKSLAGHRRRFRDEHVQKAVDGLFSIGTSTAQVVKFLQRTNPNGLFTRTDVANMKLKWRKYGSCNIKHGEGLELLGRRQAGYRQACHRCRQKHYACDSRQPTCANCATNGTACTYDPPRQANLDRVTTYNGESNTFARNDVQASAAPSQDASVTAPARAAADPQPRGRPSKAKKAQTIEILEQLRVATEGGAAPQRLELQSSSVETLVQNTCGTGEGFRYLPLLAGPNEWQTFKGAMVEVAMKANMYDVLTGAKVEPQRPTVAPGDEGKPSEIEAWNEYIKQTAIYKRRNELLLASLWTHMGQYYRQRMANMTSANAVWDALEDIFQPRGSEQAFKLFHELHSITLANSHDLKDYIHRLQTAYDNFKKLPLNTSPPAHHHGNQNSKTAKIHSGAEAVPEEMVCLLFLQNLGPEWRRWVDGLCATNNIGGFGTGARLGFKDLCGRAIGYEAMQRRELGRSGH
jgi:hypothetical protein